MIETRYKVVNKWLREIRDIDVQESSVKGSSGSFGVTTPLHCKVGEYLNTNLKFHDNTFQKSLNSGLLRTYIQNGDIVQVFYDTVAKKEVDSPYGNPQPINNQQNDQVTAMAKLFNDAGITANDLKDLVGLLKEKKANTNKQEEPKPNIIIENKDTATNEKVVDNPVDNTKTENQKNIEKTKTNISEIKPVDNSDKVVDNLQQDEQAKFKALPYQQKLKYIKGQCNDTEMLQWILANFKQAAIFNSANKKLQVLEGLKTENK